MVNGWIMNKTDTYRILNGNVIPALSVPGFGNIQKVQPDLPEVTGHVTVIPEI